MRCIHCGSSAGNDRPKELTKKEWIDVSKKLNEIGTQLVAFSGGEPLIRKDWFEIGQNVRNLGMDLSIISNGYAIDKKTISQFRKLEPYSVAISLDGATASTHNSVRQVEGSFQKCLEVLILLKDSDLPTTVVTTVHKKNFGELPKIREMLLDKEIAWQIQIANPVGRFPNKPTLSKEDFYSLGLFIAQSKNEYSKKKTSRNGCT